MLYIYFYKAACLAESGQPPNQNQAGGRTSADRKTRKLIKGVPQIKNPKKVPWIKNFRPGRPANWPVGLAESS